VDIVRVSKSLETGKAFPNDHFSLKTGSTAAWKSSVMKGIFNKKNGNRKKHTGAIEKSGEALHNG
jgi:hypothetical protein